VHVRRLPSILVTLSQEIACPAAPPLTLSGPSGSVPLTDLPACTSTVKSKTVAIRTRGGSSLALDDDGTLWVWGDPLTAVNNTRPGDRTVPSVVALPDKVVAMALGDNFALAATADGTVWAWGDNLHGELGRGTQGDSDTSLAKVKLTLPAGVTVVDLAASQFHALRAATARGCPGGSMATASSATAAAPISPRPSR
jgi:hypothetical protein